MAEIPIDQKRIRDSAPYRKSIALTEIDLKRAVELEREYNTQYPTESPFNFSKTMSKAIEIAYLQILKPELVLQPERKEHGNPSGTSLQSGQQRSGKSKKFQKARRVY